MGRRGNLNVTSAVMVAALLVFSLGLGIRSYASSLLPIPGDFFPFMPIPQPPVGPPPAGKVTPHAYLMDEGEGDILHDSIGNVDLVNRFGQAWALGHYQTFAGSYLPGTRNSAFTMVNNFNPAVTDTFTIQVNFKYPNDCETGAPPRSFLDGLGGTMGYYQNGRVKGWMTASDFLDNAVLLLLSSDNGRSYQIHFTPPGNQLCDHNWHTAKFVWGGDVSGSGSHTYWDDVEIPFVVEHWVNLYNTDDIVGSGFFFIGNDATSHGPNVIHIQKFLLNVTTPLLKALEQHNTSGIAIAIGTTTPETTVVFKAKTYDIGTSPVQLQVEVRPTSTPFTGDPNVFGEFVPPEGYASATISNLSKGAYHWRARVLASTTGATSVWKSFGTSSGVPDFIVDPPFSIWKAIQRALDSLSNWLKLIFNLEERFMRPEEASLTSQIII